MKRLVLIAAIALFTYQQHSAQSTLSIDWGNVTNYLAHGRTLSNNLACFQPGVYYSLEKGPTISAWLSLPYDRNASVYDEWDIIVDHSVDIFKQEQDWNINLHGYANYWYVPNDGNYKQSFYQGMKYNAGIHFPFKLSNESKITMTTGYDYYYYHQLGRDMGINGAGIHEFLIKFNKKYKKVKVEAKSLISNNRGAVNPNIIPGWAYVSQHLSCTINTKHVSLRPSVNYQWTLESTIHESDVLWFSLNIGKGFKM